MAPLGQVRRRLEGSYSGRQPSDEIARIPLSPSTMTSRPRDLTGNLAPIIGTRRRNRIAHVLTDTGSTEGVDRLGLVDQRMKATADRGHPILSRDRYRTHDTGLASAAACSTSAVGPAI